MQYLSSNSIDNFYRARLWRTAGAMLLLFVLLFGLQQPTSAQLSPPTATNAECIPPPADLVAWWPLDETAGQVASDIAGDPNDGTHIGDPTPITGQVAGALSFDGVDDKVVVPDGPEINFGTSDFTIDAWIRTDNADGYRPIVDKRHPGAADAPYGYNFFLQDGRLGFNINTEQAFGTGTRAGGTARTPNLADGQWHLVAVTIERNSQTGGKLYVDGQVVHTFSTTSFQGNADHTFDLVIGSSNRFFRLPPDDFFAGTIDEIEIFHRALSAAEIQALYNAQEAGKCKQTPPACLEFNGLQHCSLGEASLSQQNNLLTVSEIDSTGEDGVYIRLDRSEYVVSTLGPTSTQDITDDFGLIFTATGTVISNDGSRFENQQLAIVRLERDSDGLLRISGNMGGIGTEVPRADIYDAAGNRIGRSDFGRLSADMPPDFSDWAVTLVPTSGSDAVTIIDIPTAIDLTTGDGTVVRGSQIRYIGQGLARNVGPLSQLDITARGIPSFSLKETAAVPFSSLRIVAGNADGTAQQLVAGGTVQVYFSLLDIPATTVFGAATIEVLYDSSVLKAIECEINPDGVQKKGACNLDFAPGFIAFNAVAPGPAVSRGTRLALIRFESIGSANLNTELEVSARGIVDNNGIELPYITQNGLLEIVPSVEGDVNCDSHSSAVDALFVLQNSIGSRTAIDTCPLLPDTLHILGGNVNGDEMVDAVDGLFMLQCDVGIPNLFCEEE